MARTTFDYRQYLDFDRATSVIAIDIEIGSRFPPRFPSSFGPPSMAGLLGDLIRIKTGDADRDERDLALATALESRLEEVKRMPYFQRLDGAEFARARRRLETVLKRAPSAADELNYLHSVARAVSSFDIYTVHRIVPRHRTKDETRKALSALRSVVKYFRGNADSLFDTHVLLSTSSLEALEATLERRLASKARAKRNDGRTVEEIFVSELATGFLSSFNETFASVIFDLCGAIGIEANDRTIANYVRKARGRHEASMKRNAPILGLNLHGA